MYSIFSHSKTVLFSLLSPNMLKLLLHWSYKKNAKQYKKLGDTYLQQIKEQMDR